jgi:hypothetical protein
MTILNDGSEKYIIYRTIRRIPATINAVMAAMMISQCRSHRVERPLLRRLGLGGLEDFFVLLDFAIWVQYYEGGKRGSVWLPINSHYMI